MRIVGGALSGRRFRAPEAEGTRPTGERVREALSSALEARGLVEGASVLDLFAGTGALAFEMLSRGAATALLVEHDRRAARAIEESAAELGLAGRVEVLRLDLFGPAEQVAAGVAGRGPFSLALADPPWARTAELEPLLDALLRAGAIDAAGHVVIEHAARHAPALPAGLEKVAAYRYGDTAVLLSRAHEADE